MPPVQQYTSNLQGSVNQIVDFGTFSDSTDLASANSFRAFMVDTDGTYKVTPAGNADASPVSLKLIAGIVYPMQIRRVWSTGSVSGAKAFGLR